jgi:hypothetical protein
MHNPSIAANGDLYFTCPTSQPGQDPTWASTGRRIEMAATIVLNRSRSETVTFWMPMICRSNPIGRI